LSELQQLNISSFNFNRGEFTIYRKRGKESTMPLNDSVTAVLTDYIENERAGNDESDVDNKSDDDALFLSLQGRRLTDRQIRQLVKKYTSIGMKTSRNSGYSPHKLRATTATSLISRGNSIFDVQVKRLHEYKRQQMNVLYAIYKYFEIKKGNLPKRPITMIFGAKAAPAYTIAKDIIHLILTLSELFRNDKDVNPYLKIVMIENYNVTKAEMLIPACDISEQISLASKEASGTGNLKFMLNGAVTLGTEDGANVEIHELVGDDNIYIFGKTSDEVIKLYKDGTYSPAKLISEDELLKQLTDFIVSDEVLAIGDKENLTRFYNDITNKDWFMALLDTRDYINTKERMFSDFEDEKAWAKKMLINIANAGYFSSDRTIQEYNDDIWKLK